MFGSFLPSLRSLSNHSLLGSRSRHCYAIMCRKQANFIYATQFLTFYFTRVAFKLFVRLFVQQRYENRSLMWLQVIVDPPGANRGFRRCRTRLRQCSHPAIQIKTRGGDRTFGVYRATAILHAVADRPLVHIQSDVIHSLHGGASLVSLNQRPLSSAFVHQALLLRPIHSNLSSTGSRVGPPHPHLFIFTSDVRRATPTSGDRHPSGERDPRGNVHSPGTQRIAREHRYP